MSTFFTPDVPLQFILDLTPDACDNYGKLVSDLCEVHFPIAQYVALHFFTCEYHDYLIVNPALIEWNKIKEIFDRNCSGYKLILGEVTISA